MTNKQQQSNKQTNYDNNNNSNNNKNNINKRQRTTTIKQIRKLSNNFLVIWLLSKNNLVLQLPPMVPASGRQSAIPTNQNP